MNIVNEFLGIVLLNCVAFNNEGVISIYNSKTSKWV